MSGGRRGSRRTGPSTGARAYILRNLEDADEVIAFGFYDADLARERENPGLREQQRGRFERMAPYIESTGADGVYEVVDEITPA